MKLDHALSEILFWRWRVFLETFFLENAFVYEIIEERADLPKKLELVCRCCALVLVWFQMLNNSFGIYRKTWQNMIWGHEYAARSLHMMDFQKYQLIQISILGSRFFSLEVDVGKREREFTYNQNFEVLSCSWQRIPVE